MIKKIVLLNVMFFGVMYAGEGEGQSILEKVDNYRVPYQQFLIRTKLTSYEGNTVKESAVFDAYINGENRSLVIEKEGKNKDMKILYVDEKMWVQLPGSRRPIRITPIQRLMGQASNGDVAKVGFKADYSIENCDTVRLGEKHCYKLVMKAKRKSSTYHQINLYVCQENCQPIKAEFYLISGKHFKTAEYVEYRLFQNKLLLAKMIIYDELRTDCKTVFEYTLIREKELPVRYYNKNHLIHVRGL
ncbi:MAG: outer membrane lipoprotein-sorting protein [bacterium]